MTTLVLVGAGGHGKVVLEAFRAIGGYEVIGFLDPAPSSMTILGTPVLGDDSILARLRMEGVGAAFPAIGSNASRQRIAAVIAGLGLTLPTVVHPSAFVSPSARIGAGVIVMALAAVGTETVVGDAAIVNTGAIADHDGIIGDAAHIAPGCALAGNVSVGPRALVGIGSSVRPGIRIGADSVIGAGSAVVSDVAEGTYVGGAPARMLRCRS